MPVSINPVQRRQEKQKVDVIQRDLGRVLSAVQIGQQLFGIKESMSRDDANIELQKKLEQERITEEQTRPLTLKGLQTGINVDKARIDLLGKQAKESEAATAKTIATTPTKEDIKFSQEEKKKESIRKQEQHKVDILHKKSLINLNNAKIKAEKQLDANPDFKKLSPDIQAGVKSMATKNAGMVAINSEIKSALDMLNDPKVSKDDKLRIGQGLVKTLNSTQGADAVGVAEAERLASELQSNIVKLIPDPTQVGIAAGAGAAFGSAVPGIGTAVGAGTAAALSAGTQFIHGLVDALDDPDGLRLKPSVEGFTKRVELTQKKLEMTILRNELISNAVKQGMSLDQASQQADTKLQQRFGDQGQNQTQQQTQPTQQPTEEPRRRNPGFNQPLQGGGLGNVFN